MDGGSAIISTMQGLRQLYDHTGRRAEWKRLVEEIVPDFVGADDLPLSGREEQWSIVTQHRVMLAQESRNWAEAERLQRVRVEWNRSRSASLLARPAESLSAGEKNTLRTLAVSLNSTWTNIQREMGKPDCVKAYQEAIDIINVLVIKLPKPLLPSTSDTPTKTCPPCGIWTKPSAGIVAVWNCAQKDDRVERGKCYNQLGNVAYERFNDAKKKKSRKKNY